MHAGLLTVSAKKAEGDRDPARADMPRATVFGQERE